MGKSLGVKHDGKKWIQLLGSLTLDFWINSMWVISTCLSFSLLPKDITSYDVDGIR